MIKLSKLLENKLFKEIGNTTDTYNWKLNGSDGRTVTYQFETQDRRYYVRVKDDMFSRGFLKVDYYLSDSDTPRRENPFTTVTNENRQFKIVATVVNIVRNAWKNRSSLFDGDEFKGITFEATAKEQEEVADMTKRKKLYMAFIKNQFPNIEKVKHPSPSQVKIALN